MIRNRTCLTAILATLMPISAAYAGSGTVTLGPANSIQAAINSGLYAEIVLGPGNYNQAFTVSAANLPLTIRSSAPTDAGVVLATVLDGQFLALPVISVTSGVGSELVLDGLTVQNAAPSGSGGGIRLESASPTIRRCVVQSNTATNGGGLYCNAGSPLLEDCSFIGNTGTFGAGVYFNNSSPDITRCHFEGNVAADEGGACRFVTGTYDVQDCTFVNNASLTFGGAIASRTPSTSRISRCTFKSNHSGDNGTNGRGGGVYHNGSTASFIDNCVFDGNTCRMFGGGIYLSTGITIRNCTAHANAAGAGASFASVPNGVTIVNTIAWNNTPIAGAINTNTTTSVTYSNIQGGFTGAGNIGAQTADAPLFVNAAEGDFRLIAMSPGIDAGSSSVLVGEYPVDREGNPRAVDDPSVPDTGIAVLGINVDMGAFEFAPGASAPTCQGDINGDTTVNGADLSVLLSRFGLNCP